jgi:hypothetical protein
MVGKAKDYDIRQVNIMYFFIMNKHLFFEWYMLRCGSENIHKKTHLFHIMGSIVNKISIPLHHTMEIEYSHVSSEIYEEYSNMHVFRTSCTNFVFRVLPKMGEEL